MLKFWKNSRFESEIHLGLLAIIFLLLLLNFVSNAVIYQARSDGRLETRSHLRSAALAVTRVVQDRFPNKPTEEDLGELRRAYGLSSLTLVPSRPESSDPRSKRQWFASITASLPPGQLPDLALKLVGSELDEVTKGEADEYFMVTSVPAGSSDYLTIISANNSTLTYLDSSGSVIILVSLVAMLVVALIYFILYRFIFSPFRKIKAMASQAGRAVPGSETDVEELVADYQRIIDELETDKEKLRRLNETITSRAQSLEQFNDYLLNSIDSGIVTLDCQGRLLTISSRAGRMLGVDPLDHQGGDYAQLFHSCKSLELDIRSAVMDGRLPAYREHRTFAVTGQTNLLGVTMSAINDKTGSRIGYSILLNDHTELHRLRQELEIGKRLTAMGEMAGGLAHQIRNALGAIGGFGNLIKRRLVNASQPTDQVESLLQEATDAERLIKQFLDFTRPLQIASAETSIATFLTDILESYKNREAYRQITFKLEVDCSPDVSLDPLLMKQALTNLIDNAIESYGGRAGLVQISLLASDESLQIDVSDNGCGISNEDMELIFTPFFSKRPSGTGLGLPLAAKIVNLHGGQLMVDSLLGQGTRFTLSLPLKQASEAIRTTG